jgi:hypothetical protein
MRNTSVRDIAALETFCTNPFHHKVHASTLHTIDAPRRMIQEIGDAAQMTILPCSIAYLRDIFAPSTKNDAMNESVQVIPLRSRKLQLKSQNKLDDGQVEGYHGSGTSPLSGNFGVVTRNFSTKGGCPLSVFPFDEASKILALTELCRQQYFCNTQVI